MRYLIFGDVHGNLPALEKLFAKEKDNFDIAISHGDVVNYGPWSDDCVLFLDETPNVIKLMGNHEENYLAGNYMGTNEVATAFFNFCYPKFQNFEKIERYRNQYLLQNLKVKHTLNGQYYFPDSNLDEISLEMDTVIGHSHYQFSRTVCNRRLVNTGSVGQNRKFIDVAEYVIYNEATGNMELKNFHFDIDKVINQMETDKYPDICIKYYQTKQRS
jgi:predicted phosphodiesterase